MKIIKYTEFILEATDTVENYSNSLLSVLKKRIDKMFITEPDDQEGDDQMTIKKAKFTSKKDENKATFKEFGVKLDSSEISKKNNNLTVKFSDDENTYSIFIKIDTSEVAADIAEVGPDEDFSIDNIKKCHITLKKYDINTFEVVGQLDKNMEVKGLDEEYLINLKIELDDMFDEKDDFKIETE